MGMTCTLRRASDDAVRQLVAEPAQTDLFLYGPPAPLRRVQAGGVLGLILRFLPIQIQEVDPSSPPPAIPDDVLDLEKNWHGLHFLFTGTAWEGELPDAFLVKGGLELESGDDDNPPRLLNTEQVRDIDSFLQSLSPAELARRYDRRRMTELEIYPDVIWMRDTDQEHPALDTLLDAFSELQAFIAATRQNGQAVVVHVS